MMTSSNDFSYWNLRDRLVCQINALGAAYAHVGDAGRAEASLELAREELLRPPVYFLGDMPESYGIRVDNLLTILNHNLALLQMHGGSRVMTDHWLSLARQSFNKASEAGDRNPLLAQVSDALRYAEDLAQALRGTS